MPRDTDVLQLKDHETGCFVRSVRKSRVLVEHRAMDSTMYPNYFHRYLVDAVLGLP
jgi:hypothetical protein